MSRLAGIPIRVEPPARVDGLGGGVTAILHEIVTLLERLATANEPSAIDLRSLPMSPLDRTELKRALGEGEVQATLTAEGISTIQETRIPGVWWIEHRDAQDQLIAELIDVTYVPEILARVSAEIAAGARALSEQMAQVAAVAAGRGGNSVGRQ
jgi:hydrogenase-1 operon protein HyaF